MPITPTFPGVYLEEIPSGVRTITGVSTSVTAFVGYTPRGPVNEAVQIFDFGSFERQFGGISSNSEIGYAVQQFFLNGGTEAWVVRVAAGAQKAAVTLENTAGTRTLTVTASSEGTWGNNLRVDIDYDTINPDSRFNLTVTEYVLQNGTLQPQRSEIHRNLSMDANSPNYAVSIVNAASDLISVARNAAVTQALLDALPAGWSLSGNLSTFPVGLGAAARSISITVDGDGPYEIGLFPAGSPPADLDALVTDITNAVHAINPSLTRFSGFTAARATATGTVNASGNFVLLTSGAGGEHSSVKVGNASTADAAKLLKLGLNNGGRERDAAADLRPAETGTASGDLADVNLAALAPADQISVTVADGATTVGAGTVSLGSVPASLSALASTLGSRLRALGSIFGQVSVQIIGTRLRIMFPIDQASATATIANVGGGTLATDIKLSAGGDFVNVQRYSVGVGITRGAQADALGGVDGDKPTSANLSLITGDPDAKTGIFALEDADIFNILSIPLTAELDDTSALAIIAAATTYCISKRAFFVVDPPLTATDPAKFKTFADKLTADNHSAIYFPPVQIPDPANNMRLRSVAPSGTIAGLYARTDSARGVWKAPAGTEATLANVQALAYNLTDRENGPLNQRGLNCLRQFPVYGRVAWGARTLRGADQFADDYKYVPVRRMALFLEESLYRGTQWVVFEPNDEPLWAQIRLNIGAFMQDLFRKGAFQGTTPQQAYFVKCDKETTTQNDINLGVVNIVVGFAPLKPAEFVIIQIQQMAGQIQA